MKRPLASHHLTAERIITTQGLTFALASLAGKPGDLEFAREALKQAIANALADEFERVQAATMAGNLS